MVRIHQGALSYRKASQPNTTRHPSGFFIACSRLMAGMRRRKACRGDVEDQLLSNARWSGLQEQVELKARNQARRRCREFLEGDWGSIDWIEVYRQK